MYKIVDFVTKNPVKPNGLVFTGENSPWEVQIDLSGIKTKLNIDHFKLVPPHLLKYLPLMPIAEDTQFISLKETTTPLIKSKIVGPQLGIELYFKVEGRNPTGSFKDRGSAVEITKAKELGAKKIILASTGNMAASCACYAAAAKIPCFVLVPEGMSISKLAQVIIFGGHIVYVKGSYNDAAQLAKQIAQQEDFYLAGDYAYRVEGQKTAAFELIDQLSFQPPDAVVIPIGCGTNIASYAKGFYEYQQLGLIEKIPKLIGVQAQGAAAVVHSYESQQSSVHALKNINTIASAIAVPDPIDAIKALTAIYDSAGCAVAVSDQEILQAQYLLASEEGLFVESASAATIAALLKMAKKNSLCHQKIICILTGDGLKDADLVLSTANAIPTIYPDTREFFQYYAKINNNVNYKINS